MFLEKIFNNGLARRKSEVAHSADVDRVGWSRRGGQPLGLITSVVGLADSEQDHGDGEVDEAGDQGGDPLGPSKEVVGLNFLKVEVDLLEDVLSLKGNNAILMLKFGWYPRIGTRRCSSRSS